MMNYEIRTVTNEKIRHQIYDKVDYFIQKERLKDIFSTGHPDILRVRKIASKYDLLKLDLPREYGGMGADVVTMANIYFRLGKISANAREIVGMGHGRLLLDRWDEDRQRWIDRIVSGESFVGIGITEDGAGSDVRKIKSSIRHLDGISSILNVNKDYISRIYEADIFVFFVRNVEDGAISCVVVDDLNSIDCLRVSRQPMGLDGWSFGGLVIRDLKIPRSNVLHGEGKGLDVLKRHFAYWRILVSMLCLGSAYQAIEETIAFCKERPIFGGRLSDLQSVGHRLAESVTYIEAAKSLCIMAAKAIDESSNNALKLSSMAKWYSTEVAYKCLHMCVRLQGARGYEFNNSTRRRLLDIEGFLIADGSNDLMKSIIYKELVGKDIYNKTLLR
ncbi:acyl-CoA dehydrogenase family protein [Alicyclobacillus acidocaldarius]|uniref:Acyl-CoA dehydrogenase domain protein n=1 Tax=Alicyclobacillus acidocaldarius subsp. acidocaldarius (strain ATCC 27009 / DSM 446 / BCRC 14685 / JCM 5260 / KCTC 1825 / NBRC 15652 / NCIMB 11725 / NRRL B-14509 / 104-IA) TaxID=521098 RepID=C8WWS6_ALIAD|nr:acyl-CoA dehydrogenase family protein [Alicyclobacillus acidocaldarius]ACV58548.1 acyl-CoA dehydrogenase domain protein [Alicyclobacillus acidocaldarius subsp. acidocaldarius DSM 446]